MADKPITILGWALATLPDKKPDHVDPSATLIAWALGQLFWLFCYPP